MLACVPYLVLLAVIFTMPGGDPAGYGGEGRMAQAFSQVYALGAGVLLWIVLGVLLLVGWINGEMPRWAAICAGIAGINYSPQSAIFTGRGDLSAGYG